MRIKCPACLHNHDGLLPWEGDLYTCPDCRARFDRNGVVFNSSPMQLARPVRRPKRPPLDVLPLEVQWPTIDPVEREELRQERREEREQRRFNRQVTRSEWQERQTERQESKDANVPAILALALSLCPLLLITGGLFFTRVQSEAMKAYLGIALFLSFPMAGLAFGFAIFGLYHRKGPRPETIVSLFAAALVLFFLLPWGFTLMLR